MYDSDSACGHGRIFHVTGYAFALFKQRPVTPGAKLLDPCKLWPVNQPKYNSPTRIY